MNIGFHASTAGGLHNAPKEALEAGCTTFQIFTKSPQQWDASVLIPENVRLFKEAVKANKFYPVIVHTSYLINLASPSEELYEKSVNSLAEEIVRAEAVGADYITTHIGSCINCEKPEALARIKKAVKLAVTLSKTSKIGILFENSAKIRTPGGDFKDLAMLAKKCGARYGLTLDTCHAFAAGYDFRNQEKLNECMKEIELIAGKGRIKAVHLNDSKGELSSGLDRHEHLGKGRFGKAGISNIVNHNALKNAAFILETPKEPAGSDLLNLKIARDLAEHPYEPAGKILLQAIKKYL